MRWRAGFGSLERAMRFGNLVRRLLMTIRGRPAPARRPAIFQYGAIPYRRADGGTQFLIITSRRTRRWIFPKGGLIEGMSPAETAAEETFEEAGVRGTVGTVPLGQYRAVKSGPAGQAPLLIEMFPLEVAEVFDDWPEKAERQRRWVTLDDARHKLSEPDLVAMAEKIVDGEFI